MTNADRIKRGLARFVLATMPLTDYHALYPATVRGQNSNKTLELVPDKTSIPPLSSVPIRAGIPGAVITLQSGARVLLGYENGDPSKPYAGLWGDGTLTTIALNGGTTGLAKADHTHPAGSLLTGPSPGSPVTGTTGASGSNTTLIKVP